MSAPPLWLTSELELLAASARYVVRLATPHYDLDDIDELVRAEYYALLQQFRAEGVDWATLEVAAGQTPQSLRSLGDRRIPKASGEGYPRGNPIRAVLHLVQRAGSRGLSRAELLEKLECQGDTYGQQRELALPLLVAFGKIHQEGNRYLAILDGPPGEQLQQRHEGVLEGLGTCHRILMAALHYPGGPRSVVSRRGTLSLPADPKQIALAWERLHAVMLEWSKAEEGTVEVEVVLGGTWGEGLPSAPPSLPLDQEQAVIRLLLRHMLRQLFPHYRLEEILGLFRSAVWALLSELKRDGPSLVLPSWKKSRKAGLGWEEIGLMAGRSHQGLLNLRRLQAPAVDEGGSPARQLLVVLQGAGEAGLRRSELLIACEDRGLILPPGWETALGHLAVRGLVLQREGRFIAALRDLDRSAPSSPAGNVRLERVRQILVETVHPILMRSLWWDGGEKSTALYSWKLRLPSDVQAQARAWERLQAQVHAAVVEEEERALASGQPLRTAEIFFGGTACPAEAR